MKKCAWKGKSCYSVIEEGRKKIFVSSSIAVQIRDGWIIIFLELFEHLKIFTLSSEISIVWGYDGILNGVSIFHEWNFDTLSIACGLWQVLQPNNEEKRWWRIKIRLKCWFLFKIHEWKEIQMQINEKVKFYNINSLFYWMNSFINRHQIMIED